MASVAGSAPSTSREASTPTVDVSASASPAPAHSQLYSVQRTNEVTFFRGPFTTQGYKADRVDFKIVNPTSKVVYEADGAHFAVATKDEGVKIVDCETLALTATIPCNNATSVFFSPRGTFLTTFEVQESASHKNLNVWRVSDLSLVLSLNLEKEGRTHNPLQWSCDERHLLFHVGGELHVYDGSNPVKVLARLALPRLASFAISPLGRDGVTSHVAAFTAPKGSSPGAVLILNLDSPSKARAMLAVGQVDEANLLWNSLGSAVLIKTVRFNSGNTSYYGETRLYLLLADGSGEYNVTLQGNGTVIDVAWAPRAYEFVTLHGEARAAKATVWSAKKCEPTKTLGVGAWNTIRFSPSGRFVVLAGFGALAGEFEVWDKNKLIRLCSSQDHASPKTLTWSPCGRYFVTATLFPWLRVGNQFTVRHYTGEVVYKETVATEDLNELGVRPAAHGVYADRPASPKAIERAAAAGGGKVAIGSDGQPVPAPPKSTGYKPPHVRKAEEAEAAAKKAAAGGAGGKGGKGGNGNNARF